MAFLSCELLEGDNLVLAGAKTARTIKLQLFLFILDWFSKRRLETELLGQPLQRERRPFGEAAGPINFTKCVLRCGIRVRQPFRPVAGCFRPFLRYEYSVKVVCKFFCGMWMVLDFLGFQPVTKPTRSLCLLILEVVQSR